MGEQELFNGLIATYRDLNLKVRPLPEERLTLGRAGESVRDVALQMRDEELRFSQALKDRLSGVSLTGAFGDKGETMLIEIPSPDDTTVEVHLPVRHSAGVDACHVAGYGAGNLG